MEEYFRKFIRQKQLFSHNDYILLAVSGGKDSIAMIHLFAEAGFKFSIAHCNFQLRGGESEKDEEFVKFLAESYNVAFFSKKFQTISFAQKNNLSVQVAARNLRYDWLNNILNQEGFSYIATAHHQNDVLETVLYNFTKGSGLAGFHGIAEKVNYVIRPMLFAKRAQIDEYVKDNKLNWREDSTNNSSKYARNHLRLKVIPYLKKLNPDLESTTQQTVEKVRGAEEIIYGKIKEVKQKFLKETNNALYIDYSFITVNAYAGQLILFEILKPYGFNYDQTKNIINALNQQPGKSFYSSTYSLTKDRDYLVIIPYKNKNIREITIKEDDTYIKLERGTLYLKKIPYNNKEVFKSNDENIALLDFHELIFPLKIRNWLPGDWFCPLGMRKKKKLSDFFIDQKIPLNVKQNIPVLISGTNIAWIIGYRIDDRYKASQKTSELLQLTYIND